MTTGRRRHKVSIGRYVIGKVAGGQQTNVDSSLGTVWGEIVPLRGDERLNGLRLERPVTHRIVIRFQEGFMPADYIIHSGVRYRVRSAVDVDCMGRYIDFLAEAGSDQ